MSLARCWPRSSSTSASQARRPPRAGQQAAPAPTHCSGPSAAVPGLHCPAALRLPPPLAVWLINYKHFLSWKPFPGSWIPDPSTVEFSVAKATFYFKVAPACHPCRWWFHLSLLPLLPLAGTAPPCCHPPANCQLLPATCHPPPPSAAACCPPPTESPPPPLLCARWLWRWLWPPSPRASPPSSPPAWRWAPARWPSATPSCASCPA